MALRWAPINGRFSFTDDAVRFHGEYVTFGDTPGVAVGTAMSDQWFSGGTLSADVTFASVGDKSACDLVLWYHPERQFFVSAGLSSNILFGIRHFDSQWTIHNAVGSGANLEAGRKYHVQVTLRGSRVYLAVDGVQVCSATLPFTLTPSQAGVWCRGDSDITIENFCVQSETPRVFVVMEFKSPFDELHHDVLKLICREFGLDAVRADETYGPGLIISDIERQIDEAKFVIAEITPANPNVYYEVGYARGKRKPTLLLADKSIDKLPFEVSPFRTLFYENSISGKSKMEEGLRRHILAILTERVL
jgi:hypothetical protein